ncbi:MAG: hydrolase [Calditerrivibrio sp.]|nr:hydrolase [Calditerrivibrio sp.]
MKVYLSQIKPNLGDINKNLDIHKNEIHNAVEKGMDLIVFPELSLSGYYLRDLVFDVSIRLNSPVIKLFEQLSEKIAIIVGFPFEDENHQFFNAAGYFENGRLKYLHKKVYLPNYTMFEESRYFAAGNEFIAFDMLGSKTGLLICEDALHLSALYLYSIQNVKNIIIISNSPARGFFQEKFYSKELWHNTIKFISNNLTVNTLFVNRVGVEDGVTFWGGSVCVDALGNESGACALFYEDRSVVDIDDTTVRRSRITSPFYRDEDLTILKEFIKKME